LPHLQAAARRLGEAHTLLVAQLLLRYVTRGVPPLVHATGAGAAGRQAIGTAVFYDMIGSTCLRLSFTPVRRTWSPAQSPGEAESRRSLRPRTSLWNFPCLWYR